MSSTLCYKDGHQLPLLNFTTLCIGYGRYVIFYNERLHGVSYPSDYQLGNLYTELCEVIVQGNGSPLFFIFDDFASRKLFDNVSPKRFLPVNLETCIE